MKRTTKRTVIQFNVTAAEKRKIQQASKRAGMTVSQWLRWIAAAHTKAVL